MGVRKLLRLPSRCYSFFVLLIILSYAPGAFGQYDLYSTKQLNALQALWGAWNRSTPDLSKNLPGWSSSKLYPCRPEDTYVGAPPNWRGVECLKNFNCKASNCSFVITSLTLKKASIVGSLPREIGEFDTLITLELTGNPNLTGILPYSLSYLENLQNVYLQDNGFVGYIPDFLNLQNVDLSGNRFITTAGSFPLPNMRRNGLAQMVNLGRNDLNATIPEDAFTNMTELIELDLSYNRFTGAPPNLLNCTNLQRLNLQYNDFNGTLPNLTTDRMPYLRNVDLSGNAFTGSTLGFLNGFSNSRFLETLILDNNSLSGSLDISALSGLGLLSTKTFSLSGPLSVLSLMFNNITEVVYTTKQLEEIYTAIRYKTV